MSLQQRWRALKFNVKDQKARLAQLPPFLALVAAAEAVRRALAPAYALAAALGQRWSDVNEAYNQFLAEETKKKWTWSKRNKKEMALLKTVPHYVFGKRERERDLH